MLKRLRVKNDKKIYFKLLFFMLILSLILLGIIFTTSSLYEKKGVEGNFEFQSVMNYKFNDSDMTCELQSILLGTPNDMTIPYKVKKDGFGNVIEQDLQGDATGDGWYTVTSIGDNAFNNCTNLEIINNFGSILRIGEGAFNGCANLKNINFNFYNINYVGANAFANTVFYNTLYDSATDNVVVGDILIKIKSNLSGAQEVDGVRVIASGALAEQNNLTNLTLGSSVQYLGDKVFENCNALEIIDITQCQNLEISTEAFINDNEFPLVIKCNVNDEYEKMLKNTTALTINMNLSFEFQQETENAVINIDNQNIVYDKSESNYRAFDTYQTSLQLQENQIYSTSVKWLFASTFQAKYKTYTNIETQNVLSKVVESYACYYEDTNNNKQIVFQTENGSVNHDNPATISYETYFVNNYSYIFNQDLTTTMTPCFTGDSKVMLADGTYKLAKDIEYDDLLLTWNLDEGCFAASYPLWITKSTTTTYYYLIEFDDGSNLKVIVSHCIYSLDKNMFVKSIDSIFSQEGATILKLAVDENGNALLNENNEFYHTKSKIKSIKVVQEEVLVCNIITNYHLNNYVNGVLCSTNANNIYQIEEENEQLQMKFNQQQLDARKNGVNTLYNLEDFEGTFIDRTIFEGARIAEFKPLGSVAVIANYVARDIDESVVHPYPTNENGQRIFIVSTSEGYKEWFVDGELFTLPTPTNVDGKQFVGWYDNGNGKYYSAGDTVEIYLNSHFVAKWA